MTNRWASDDKIGSSDIFETLHDGLTAALIATEREKLMTCRPNESLADIVSQNKEQQYDYLPVESDEGDKIVGLLHATAEGASLEGTVEEHFLPLSEEDLIGADASILDFIKNADSKPCRLIVSESRIMGLVTLSDLQKLPVRAALFALITGFELTMAEAIRKKYKTDEHWLRLLSECRQKKINGEIEKSKEQDGFVDKLLFTQFYDKRDILIKSFSFSRSKTKLRHQLENIQKLRDNLAHANEYAATRTDAENVCFVVRNLLELREEIKTQLLNIFPRPNSRELLS